MRNYFLIILSVVLLSGCIKNSGDIPDPNAPSNCPTKFKITASSVTPTVGDDLVLTGNPTGYSYDWFGPGKYINQSAPNKTTISNIKINQSGWYYGSLVNPQCNTLHDSIFIDVQYKQGTPSCTLTNNLITATGLPDLNATSVIKSFSLSENAMELSASGSFGYPDYSVLFNSYNGHNEPKDGIYVTTNVAVFDPLQDANVIFVSCLYSSIYFASQEGQNVYVSHVNGKLRVSVCGLLLDGEFGGNSYISSVNGQITQNN
jgi:hypothetical protein